MPPIIEAQGLTKRFGDVRALDGLDITAESGHVTALLGPNGAGKTTFVSAVATLLRPDSGTIRVAGVDAASDPKRVREIIGLAGQYASVEPAMTGMENLRMVARLFGLGRRDAERAAGEVLERLELGDAGDRLVRNYSGGMRRRLDPVPASSDALSSSCSTSRRPVSTRAAARTCGRPSAASWPGAPTSCSRRSTSKRPTSWPATS
jgi:ABC-2 type transport system ATP-binding protein